MKYLIAFVVLVVLALGAFFIPIPAVEAHCRQPFKTSAGEVLCCCPTYGGGQCCAYVSFCGSYVPGCNCWY